MKGKYEIRDRASKRAPTKPRRPRFAVPVKNPVLAEAMDRARQSKRNEEK